ncbi:LYR motif-containing protein [Phanerochaete sordida]|uniref:LYR motif-containing protein n=1 Tax=Phanerochaete sordida TaxID=48140 RepID=A0A9P3GMU6_9APHY|nr:LYR motif-containing protein [Phanerochaete sordida]
MAAGLSGLQKEVLALYRRALRMVQTKPLATRPKFRLFVRYTFKTQSESISPRDVSAIEHLLRKGRRQLETYEDAQVRDIWVSNVMREWETKEGGRRSFPVRNES